MIHNNHQKSLERLAELSRLLDKATEEIAEYDEAAVLAKQTYEVAFVQAFLKSSGSIELRKQIANFDVRDEKLESELAASKLRALKERIKTLGIQIEVGRSLASAQKIQASAETIGQYT